MAEIQISDSQILQIVPLPEGWWHDEWNRVPALALVEITYRWGDDDEWHKGREILPLNEDLTVNFPASCADAHYLTHPFGDRHDFIQYRAKDESLA